MEKRLKIKTKLAVMLAVFCIIGLTQINGQNSITIGEGNSGGFCPINKSADYSASEFIYLQPEIDSKGEITKFAIYKTDGKYTKSLSGITIYMKHTSATSLSSEATSTTGYTEVFSGSFTNNAVSGWMEVELDEAFPYNNTDNLQVLIINAGGSAISESLPEYQYHITGDDANSNRHRANSGSTTWDSSKTLNEVQSLGNRYRPDVKLQIGESAVELKDYIADVQVYPIPFATNYFDIKINSTQVLNVEYYLYDFNNNIIHKENFEIIEGENTITMQPVDKILNGTLINVLKFSDNSQISFQTKKVSL